mgnify:CR=1 FL=1
MATINIPVKCSKETAELGLGIASFLGEVKKAVAAMQGVENVKDELEEDKVAFVNATVVAGAAVVGALLK